MGKTVLAIASVLALASAAPASAALSVSGGNVVVSGNGGGSTTLLFNGTNGGVPTSSLSTSLFLNFVSAIDGVYTFSYRLDNTSTLDSEVTAFGFNTDPDSLLTILTGLVFDSSAPNRNFPNTIGVREECVTTGNCTGGGSGGDGVADGGFTTGSFSLTVGNTNVSTLSLTDFAIRYQSIPTGAGSGTGVVVGSVPEPATWALMLVGFGAIGYSMRRRRRLSDALPQMA